MPWICTIIIVFIIISENEPLMTSCDIFYLKEKENEVKRSDLFQVTILVHAQSFFFFFFYLCRTSTEHITAPLADEGNYAYYQSRGAHNIAVKASFSWAKGSEFEPRLDISVEVTSQC